MKAPLRRDSGAQEGITNDSSDSRIRKIASAERRSEMWVIESLTARLRLFALSLARGGDQQGNKQQSQKHSIAETCVWREVLQSVRQRGINDTLLAQAKLFNDSPIRVDHR